MEWNKEKYTAQNVPGIFRELLVDQFGWRGISGRLWDVAGRTLDKTLNVESMDLASSIHFTSCMIFSKLLQPNKFNLFIGKMGLIVIYDLLERVTVSIK